MAARSPQNLVLGFASCCANRAGAGGVTNVHWLQFALGVAVGFLVSLWACGGGAGNRPGFQPPLVIRDTVREIHSRPVTVRDSIAPQIVRVRRFRPETVFDTVLIEKRDTAYLSPPFEAVDTNRVLASGDTLARVSFRFPENLFAYDFRPRPDTAWRFRETVTSIPAAPPGHWSLGLTTGYGGTVTQDPAGNLQARLGPFVGLGISYRLIEF